MLEQRGYRSQKTLENPCPQPPCCMVPILLWVNFAGHRSVQVSADHYIFFSRINYRLTLSSDGVLNAFLAILCESFDC